jgi:hypothetical protein
MSYDITLFRPAPGENPLALAHARLEAALERRPGLSPGVIARRNTRLVTALFAYNPALRSITHATTAAPGDARASLGGAQQILLQATGTFSGIDIYLFEETAALHVPYWHTGERAAETIAELWEYMRIIQHEADYVAYDPQLDRMLDLAHDQPAVLRAYRSGATNLRRITAERST